MHKFTYLIASIFLICTFIACKKDSNDPQLLILGKWKLQRQHSLEYHDGVASNENEYVPTQPNSNYTDFNSNGSVITVYKYQNGFADTTWGNYHLVGNQLLFSNVQSHVQNAGVVMTPEVSYILFGKNDDMSVYARIDQISADKLTVHAELFPQWLSHVRNVVDQYYTR